ncbi:MAG: helix-hairpin-helix domain-containing protein [Flavobacteriaceae bacterium]|nr:helix-hairpin-helix domain-containing protein [Flavobacteriaceae bacterium]
MKIKKSHFKFNKGQRSGIFLIFICITLLQLFYFFFDVAPETSFGIDDLVTYENEVDSLKKIKAVETQFTIFPFNPNFISDHKGYILGMSSEEIDRLHEFRKQNKFVNSAKEFQNVTKVSDSLLAEIKVYFKFPNWANKTTTFRKNKPFKNKLKRTDINTATEVNLIAVYGVGDKLASRIIKFREALGGFITIDQIADVYGLSQQTQENIKQAFYVGEKPVIEKININTASEEVLSSLVYINYQLALNITEHRTLYGQFNNLEDLKNVEGFPVEKFERIKVYLLSEKEKPE